MQILNIKDVLIEIGAWNATEYRFVNGIMQTPRYPVEVPYNIREDAYYTSSGNEFSGYYYAFRGEEIYILDYAEFCNDFHEIRSKKQQMYSLLRTGLSPVDVFTFLSL